MTGNELLIRIILSNDENNEFYYADNILVQGTPITPPACATSFSPTDGETNIAVDGSLSWDMVSGASGYKIFLGTDAGATTIENGTDLGDVTTYTPSSDLDFLTEYFWKIVPYNSIGDATGCDTLSFTTEDVSYCDAGANIEDEYLNRVQVGAIDNNNTGWSTDGYGDFSDLSTTLQQGQANVALSIEIGTYYTGDDISVWVDWDKNGEFDTSESIVCDDNASATNSYTFDVPVDASLGALRMRIRLKYYNSSCETNGACDYEMYGEVEDYTLNIVSACSANAYNIAGGGSFCLGGTGFEITLDGSESGVEYQLYLDGSTAIGGAIAGDGNAISFGNQTAEGTYTVVGHHIAEDCDVNMNGSVSVTVNPIPTISAVAQNADVCVGSAALINLTGLIPNSTFTLNYTISGVVQTAQTGLTANASGNSSFSTAALSESDNGKTLEITDITITSSTPNCSNSFSGITTTLVALPTEVSVAITANPSGAVCPGTTVNYTATPVNGGSSPSYQWKVNGVNVGTDSDTYSYEPADGDEVSCVLTSSSSCATGSVIVPILFFSWDDDSKPLTEADYGLSAISIDSEAKYDNGRLTPGPTSGGERGIDLTFSGAEPDLNFEGLEYSIDYRRDESQAEMFTRGSYLIITSGSDYSVTYRVSDGAGSYTTISSGDVYAIPQDDVFRNYRFLYNPIDGIGRLTVEGTEVWQSPSPTPGLPLYWDGASSENLLVGKYVDASGNETPTFDNLSMSIINSKTAKDSIIAVVAPLIEPTLSSNSPVCSGGDAEFTISGTAGYIVTYTGDASGTATIGAGGTVDVSITGISANATLNLTNVSDGSCNQSISGVSETVTVNSLPNVTANSTATEICEGESITLTGSGASTYTWDNGVTDGVAFNPAATTGYTVTGTDANGCENTDQITITVNPIPATPTASSNSPVCLGDNIELTTPSVTGATYAWTGPNGFSSSQQNPTVPTTWVGNGGTYSVTVTVNGCTSAIGSTDVVVDPTTQGGWVEPAHYDPICLGNVIPLLTLKDYTGTVVRWERRLDSGSWEDVGNAGSITYSETPSSGGTWDFRVLVQSGGCSAEYSTLRSIVVNPTLSITLGTNPTVCQTETTAVLPYTAVTGSPAQWILTFDAAAVAAGFSSPQNSTVDPAPGNFLINVPYSVAAGIYNATLRVITYYPACTSVDYPVTVTVADGTPVSVTISGNDTVCNGTTVTYTAAPVNGGSSPVYQWQVNGSDVGANSNTYSYNPADGDTVSCILTSDISCATGSPATSNKIGMTVYPAFSSGEISGTGQTICSGGNPTVIGSTTDASGGDGTITYEWQVNGNPILNSNSPTYDPPVLTASATYTRWAKDNTCEAAFVQSAGSWTVTVQGVFDAGEIETTGETICYNTTPTATIGSVSDASGGDETITYQWQSSTDPTFGSGVTDVASNTATYTPTAALTQTTYYRRQASDGTCSTSFTSSVGVWEVTVLPTNTINLTSAAGTDNQTLNVVTPITTITYATTGATSATFSGLPNGVTGNWNSNEVSISGTPTQIGTFNYTVTLTGGCGTVEANGTITVNNTFDVSLISPAATCNAASGEINGDEVDTTSIITFRVEMVSGQSSWNPNWKIAFVLTPDAGASIANVQASSGILSGTYEVTNIPSTNGAGFVEITMEVTGSRFDQLTVELEITSAEELDYNIQDIDSDDWNATFTLLPVPDTGPITTN